MIIIYGKIMIIIYELKNHVTLSNNPSKRRDFFLGIELVAGRTFKSRQAAARKVSCGKASGGAKVKGARRI